MSVVLDARGTGMPCVLHWGAELPPGEEPALALAAQPAVAQGTLDAAVPFALVPERAAGWRGRPGLSGSRAGTAFSARFACERLDATATTAVIDARDPAAALSLRTELALEDGVLRLRHSLRNDGDDAYALTELGCVLPTPASATEVLDLAGRWCRERIPQRRGFAHGTWLRESRRGRTGHDATLLLVAGTAGFGFRGGEVWGVHLAWSGNHAAWAERGGEGQGMLGAAELLEPGELRLAPGETYATPWLWAAWSDHGLDGLSAALHTRIRATRPLPHSPRPVVLNTWEAVYFDHDLERLKALADRGAAAGVERFVLDDGWFTGRRDDTRGLGDWEVDPEVWPDGLHPLTDHVTGLGMEFGLWVEPEMVNPDSELARTHPDWLLAVPGRLPPPARHQQVLDLANPAAFAHILERLDALLREYPIAALKWDHNRDLLDVAHDGMPAVHAQTLAVYALLDELRARHPGVEIETCASGGGRVDLGILARTDRVWASDTNDALERQAIQRWTGLLLPPELIGAHIGGSRAHTTGRELDLSFRAATALFGHLGLELDLDAGDDPAEAIAAYKRLRGLLHSGVVVRADHPDPAAWVHGVVAPDGSAAVFAYVQLATSVAELPAPARLPGLDGDRRYAISRVPLGGEPFAPHRDPPGWADGIVLSGRALASAGLAMPLLGPAQALVLELRDAGPPATTRP